MESTPRREIGLSADEVKARRAATAPPLPPRSLTTILVEGTSEIVQGADIARLIRAPRYFEDDFGGDTQLVGITRRCFNCGQIGHRGIECTNATRQRPCHLCAQLGHEGRDCPNRLCFKCGRPGHVSRDCTSGRAEGWEAAVPQCNRCGAMTCACAGKGDYFRYENGCTGGYSPQDLLLCRCYVCGKAGHLCCKAPPQASCSLPRLTLAGLDLTCRCALPRWHWQQTPVPAVTCYCCGAEGHYGEDCPQEDRPHLKAERAGDARRAQAERDREIEVQMAASRPWLAGGSARGGRGHNSTGSERGAGAGQRFASTGRNLMQRHAEPMHHAPNARAQYPLAVTPLAHGRSHKRWGGDEEDGEAEEVVEEQGRWGQKAGGEQPRGSVGRGSSAVHSNGTHANGSRTVQQQQHQQQQGAYAVYHSTIAALKQQQQQVVQHQQYYQQQQQQQLGSRGHSSMDNGLWASSSKQSSRPLLLSPPTHPLPHMSHSSAPQQQRHQSQPHVSQ
ncbi:hypothetical protein QJQ45_019518, partial [Haematococcus lacustris]